MAATCGTAAKARSVWMRIGTPASSRNCLGAVEDEWPAAIRVPRPAAGRITNTRINTGVYQLWSACNRSAAGSGARAGSFQPGKSRHDPGSRHSQCPPRRRVCLRRSLSGRVTLDCGHARLSLAPVTALSGNEGPLSAACPMGNAGSPHRRLSPIPGLSSSGSAASSLLRSVSQVEH